MRLADDTIDHSLRRGAVCRLAHWLSRRQHHALLPRSRLALLERNRGSQHVPYARQSFRHRRTIAFRPQSGYRRLGSVMYITRSMSN